jgi:hypothetical protein
LQTAVTLVQSERFVDARERADFHLVEEMQRADPQNALSYRARMTINYWIGRSNSARLDVFDSCDGSPLGARKST